MKKSHSHKTNRSAEKTPSAPVVQKKDTTVQGGIREAASTSSADNVAALNHPHLSDIDRQQVAANIGRIHGNSYLQRILQAPANRIQREPLKDVVDKPLASMTFSSPTYVETEGEVEVSAELTPADTPADKFEGFPSRLQAYSRAWASPNLCAVVLDSADHYHTLDTGWPGKPSTDRVTIVPYRHGFKKLSWVNVPGTRGGYDGEGPTSWQGRVARVTNWRRAWENDIVPTGFGCPHGGQHGGNAPSLKDFQACLQNEYARLLAEALSLTLADVHIARKSGDFDPDKMVTFDLFDNHANAYQLGGNVSDERDATPSRPGISVNASAFNGDSYLHTIATAIHEATHYEHALQNVDLFEQWQQSNSKKSFKDWLKQQLKRRRITQEQHDLAAEELQSGDNNASEVLSYVEGFTAIYHRLPIDESMYRFQSLIKLADYWMRAGHETHDNTIARLSTYYDGLSSLYQDDLLAQVRSMGEGGTLGGFWRTFFDSISS